MLNLSLILIILDFTLLIIILLIYYFFGNKIKFICREIILKIKNFVKTRKIFTILINNDFFKGITDVYNKTFLPEKTELLIKNKYFVILKKLTILALFISTLNKFDIIALDNWLYIIVNFGSLLFFIDMFITNTIKFCYITKYLITGKFITRNSPINLGSSFGKILFSSSKYALYGAGSTLGFLASLSEVDDLIESTGRKPIIKPYIGNTINKIIGSPDFNNNSNPNTNDLINKEFIKNNNQK
jgi:hypothetical protein